MPGMCMPDNAVEKVKHGGSLIGMKDKKVYF